MILGMKIKLKVGPIKTSKTEVVHFQAFISYMIDRYRKKKKGSSLLS